MYFDVWIVGVGEVVHIYTFQYKVKTFSNRHFDPEPQQAYFAILQSQSEENNIV